MADSKSSNALLCISIIVVALATTSVAQNLAYIDHPGGGAGSGWTANGNVTLGGMNGYQIPLTNGTPACTNVRTIPGLGTQPKGTANLQLQSNGNTSQTTKQLPASAFPSSGTYRFDIEVAGVSTCPPQGCGVVGAAFPRMSIAIDGSPQTIHWYPTGTIASPQTITPTINAGVQYASFQYTAVAGVGHAMTISMLPGLYMGQNSGGFLQVGQVLIYPNMAGTTIKADCGVNVSQGNWTNSQVTGSDVISLVQACQAKKSGFTCTSIRTDMKNQLIYPASVGYVGCGSAGTLQCDLVDIE